MSYELWDVNISAHSANVTVSMPLLSLVTGHCRRDPHAGRQPDIVIPAGAGIPRERGVFRGDLSFQRDDSLVP